MDCRQFVRLQKLLELCTRVSPHLTITKLTKDAYLFWKLPGKSFRRNPLLSYIHCLLPQIWFSLAFMLLCNFCGHCKPPILSTTDQPPTSQNSRHLLELTPGWMPMKSMAQWNSKLQKEIMKTKNRIGVSFQIFEVAEFEFEGIFGSNFLEMLPRADL